MASLLRHRGALVFVWLSAAAILFTGSRNTFIHAQQQKGAPSKVAAIIQSVVPAIAAALAAPPQLRGSLLARLSSPSLTVTADGQVDVEVHAAGAVGGAESIDLVALGATVLASTGDVRWPAGVTPPPDLGIIAIRVPAASVDRIAALTWVAAITPAERQPPDVGAFTSEGVALHRSAQANSLGFTGAGITVGAISDGVSNLAAAQLTADLPPTVNVLSTGSGDEGTAMLEIIHDLAPGAALAFHATGGGVANHITALNNLATAGARIIAEDIAFDAEPAFQKGAAATAAESLAVGGVMVHSSAGNNGARHAARMLATGTGTNPDGTATSGCAIAPTNTVAIAGGGDTTFDVSVPAGQTLSATLQWSEPRAIFPTPGRGGFTDLDLYVLDTAYACLASSTAAQGNGVGDTLEQVTWMNGGMNAVTVKLVVNVFGTSSAVAAPTLDLRWRNAGSIDGTTRAGSVNPDSNYTFGATSAGAADAGQSTSLATVPIEGFSAGGPVQLFSTTICPNGAAGPCTGVQGGAGESAGAPTWTAADGVVITGAGGFGSGNCPAISSGDCRFFGTSAAAPHAAAIAALAAEALGPAAGPLVIAQRLAETARDRGTAGFDNTWGFGVLNALAAVGEEADLSVAKDCKPDTPIDAGQTATCTIFVDNHGPSLARLVVLTDTFTANGAFSFGTITASQGTCSTSGTVVTCSLGDLPAQPPLSAGRATVTINVSAAEARNISDLASAVSETFDPDTSNNSATDTVIVRAAADLRITKADAPDPVIAGTDVTYTMTITNDGPSAAAGVVVHDFVPAGLTIVSVSGTGGATCQAGVPGDPSRPTSCAFGTLAASASRTMTLVATVGAGVTGTIHNDASVFSDVHDPDAADNHATQATTVNAVADLAILKSATPAPVLAGRLLSYTLRVSNLGPSQAVGVMVEDFLPDDVDFVGASFSNGTGSCVLQDVNPAPPTKKVVCQLGQMPLNDTSPVFIHIDTIVKSGTADGAEISNLATVASATADPVAGNNSSVVMTTVLNRADLAIVKTSDADVYKPTSTIVYTILVTNNGPSDALNVVVTDLLPAMKQAVYVFDTAGCSLAGTTLTCQLGTITAGASATFNVHLTVKGNQGDISNTATVTSSIFDPTGANNSSIRVVKVGNK